MHHSLHQNKILVIFVVRLIPLFSFPLGIQISNHIVGEITMRKSYLLQLVYLIVI
jgi:hypothetical protein